jgi:hypothetical protein
MIYMISAVAAGAAADQKTVGETIGEMVAQGTRGQKIKLFGGLPDTRVAVTC